MKMVPVGFLVVLAACVPAVTTPVQEIAPVGRSSAIWTTDFNLRSYLSDGTEVAGAACQVRGPGFSGQATTPARIRIPVFEAGRVTTSLTCTLGQQTVTVAKVCRYGASEPESPYDIDVSTCYQSDVPVVFARR